MPVPPKISPDIVAVDLRERMEKLLHGVQDAYPDQPSGEDDRWWLPARLGGTAPTPERALAMDEAEAAERRARRAERNGNGDNEKAASPDGETGTGN
jgi:hypothetical protein